MFFSDIVQFTDLSDTLKPERLALVINTYLLEMASIAIECSGRIEKFIGDAILVFFGDPETESKVEDSLHCTEMAIRMRQRVEELREMQREFESRYPESSASDAGASLSSSTKRGP